MPLMNSLGKEFGEKLISILGLPKGTKGFELRCYVGEMVTVKCEYYPEIENGLFELGTVLEEYTLVKKGDENAISNNTK